MGERPDPDTSRVYHSHSAGAGEQWPDRFAVYADGEETEELTDSELLTTGAFDPGNILMWGLEDDEEAFAQHRGGERREQFSCTSAQRLRELLELAGYGPLRVLYL